MKLDAKVLRYLSTDDFRVLTAVEMGMKNHEIVPTTLICAIASLSRGLVHNSLKTIARHKLVHHESKPYDSYRLTSLGYDFLALRTLSNRDSISSIGRQIGVGKESDVYVCGDKDDVPVVLKVHRLGRTSFRTAKSKRDYLVNRKSAGSWLYFSRLACLREAAYLEALGKRGFPVPRFLDNNRHCLLMELIDGAPLNQFREAENPESIFRSCINIVTDLADVGLVHGDLNEFNLMCNDEGKITLIDLPQMIPIGHPSARLYFERDVECLCIFFQRRFGYSPSEIPVFPSNVSDLDSSNFVTLEDSEGDNLMLSLHADEDEDGDDNVDGDEREEDNDNEQGSEDEDDDGSEEEGEDEGEDEGEEKEEGHERNNHSEKQSESSRGEITSVVRANLKRQKRKKSMKSHSKNDSKMRQKKGNRVDTRTS